MSLSDSELGMVEQLAYINPDLIEAATGKQMSPSELSSIINSYSGSSVNELLNALGINEDTINNLENAHGDEIIDGAVASGKEWASILRYLTDEDNPASQLELSNTMPDESGKKILALCFTDPDSDEAYVAFKGTTDAEWIDNVEGLNRADTEDQIAAYEYIESLPYDNITVTGHSKGGNKAMYVAVRSDKVKRCVSWDGQGFSQEFMDKYAVDIQNNAGKITNISLSTDFVHILMFPIPGSNQLYVQGYGVGDDVAQNHSPNSFFKTDANGNLILDENGNPILVYTTEDESLTMLHRFTTFILNNADDEQKKVLVEYISEIFNLAFNEKVEFDQLIEYVFSEPDKFALLLAFLVKYMDEYDLDADDVDKLLAAFGLGELNSMLKIEEFEFMGKQYYVSWNLSNILNLIKDNLTDGDNDYLIRFVFGLLFDHFLKDYDIDVSGQTIWEKVNKQVGEIESDSGASNAKIVIRDFSAEKYEVLMAAINQIEQVGETSVSGWKHYAGEGWFSALFVNLAIKGINAYFNKLSETSAACKDGVEEVFENVAQIDSSYGKKLSQEVETLRVTNTVISALAESIG